MLFVYMNVAHLGFPKQSFQLSTMLIGRAKGIKGLRSLRKMWPSNDRPAACGWCSSSSPLPAIKFGTTVSCFCQMLRFRKLFGDDEPCGDDEMNGWSRWMDDKDSWHCLSIASRVGWASCNLDGWHTSHHHHIGHAQGPKRSWATSSCQPMCRVWPWGTTPDSCGLSSRGPVEMFGVVSGSRFFFFPNGSTWEGFFSSKKKTPDFSMKQPSTPMSHLNQHGFLFRWHVPHFLKSEMAACFRLCSECLGTTFLMLTLGLESTEISASLMAGEMLWEIWSDFVQVFLLWFLGVLWWFFFGGDSDGVEMFEIFETPWIHGKMSTKV